MGRETTDGPAEERSIERVESVRTDPDSEPGVVVDRRPESVWSARPVLFWLTIGLYVFLAALFGANAWIVGAALKRFDTAEPFRSMLEGIIAPYRTLYFVAAIGPLLAIAVFFYQRWAADKGANRRTTRLVVASLGIVYMGAFLLLVPWQIDGMSWIEYVPAFLLGTAGGLVTAYAVDPNARVSLHCRKCRYEFVPGKRAPRICPECGRDWLRRRGLVRRRHEKKFTPPKVFGMLLFGAAWLAIVAAPRLHGFVPTDWLIPRAGMAHSMLPASDWARLQPSVLTDEQVHRLAEAILNKRRANQEIDFVTTDAWFEAAITEERLPPALTDQYHHYWFELSIVAPESVASDQPFEVAMEMSTHGMWLSNTRSIWVVFGGYRLDRKDLQARADEATSAYALAAAVSGPAVYTIQENHPTGSFVASTPGEHTITAGYWLIAMPGSANKPNVTWKRDGSLQEPPEALYFRRFEIGKTIEVLTR